MSKLASVNEDGPNGTVLTDADGKRYVEVPTHSEAQERVTALRKRLIDLPDVPQKMNTISVVLAYELFGLSPQDIATAIGLLPEQVGRIQMLDAYLEMRESVVSGIQEAETDAVRDIFQQKARRSAERIVELAESSRADIALSASKEVLDRSGNTVKQIVEHQHRLEGGLIIEHIKRDNSKEVPTVELSHAEFHEETSANDGSSSPRQSVRGESGNTTERSKRVQPKRPRKSPAKRGAKKARKE